GLKHRAGTDIVNLTDITLLKFPTVSDRKPYDLIIEIRWQQCCIHIILSQMDAVCPHLFSKVRCIVDDERDTVFPAKLFNIQSKVEKFRSYQGICPFFPELEHGHPVFQCLLDNLQRSVSGVTASADEISPECVSVHQYTSTTFSSSRLSSFRYNSSISMVMNQPGADIRIVPAAASAQTL